MVKKNVTVIIPSFNRAHILHRTIPSYIQDVTLEVIVVDDGSDDYTKKAVANLHKKYKEIKYIRLKKHRGLPSAKNIGVKKANGKYIYFGDDDACLYPGTLLRLRNAIENYPADIAAANGSYASEWKQIQNMDKYIAEQFIEPFHERCVMDFNTGRIKFSYKYENITEGLCIMACFMIRAELAKKEKFDSSYIGNAAREDIDFHIRQARKGKKMVYVPDAYEIDIPRNMVKGGGCHSMKLWKIVFYTINNHKLLLDRHYDYLKQEGYISISKNMAMRLLIKDIIKDVARLWKSCIITFIN